MIKWITCPVCGKRLCKADAEGIVHLWCKRCKKEVIIDLKKTE